MTIPPGEVELQVTERAPLDLALDTVNSRFEVVDTVDVQTTKSMAPNGREYERVYAKTFGDRPPGSAANPKVSATHEEAITEWILAATSLEFRGEKVIFWRVLPHIVAHGGGFFVMSCFALGHEPRVKPDAA